MQAAVFSTQPWQRPPPCRLLGLRSSGSKGLGPCLLWSAGYAHVDIGDRRRGLGTLPSPPAQHPAMACWPTHGDRIHLVRDSRSLCWAPSQPLQPHPYWTFCGSGVGSEKPTVALSSTRVPCSVLFLRLPILHALDTPPPNLCPPWP